MGKKVLRLFLETMLRAVVIILAVGIVVIGALLIKTLVKNNSLKDSKKTTTGKEIVTEDRKSTRLNSSHSGQSRMPSSA